MADIPKRDRAIGLSSMRVGGGTSITVYNPEVMLRVLQAVAEGKLLKEIEAEPGMPSRTTIQQWIMTQPEAARGFYAARELSGMAFEEMAIDLGMQLTRGGKAVNGVKVRAAEAAMNQLRWSASRRNPRLFGDTGKQTIIVPVQINTSLPLGEVSVGAGTEDYPNIYQIDAKVISEEKSDSEVPATIGGRPMFTKAAPGSRHQKEVLAPADPSLHDEWVKNEEEWARKKAIKNAKDLDRWNARRKMVIDGGGDPSRMTYPQMKQWLVENDKWQEPN